MVVGRFLGRTASIVLLAPMIYRKFMVGLGGTTALRIQIKSRKSLNSWASLGGLGTRCYEAGPQHGH